ncbi:MAG TPA: lipopolysaccharide transport periplasmic protein LptA [Geobacteraceae bacterium]|nr:lipopolysaccharide transport periplasmic protein LptA [Geobacteraceae bacterium]
MKYRYRAIIFALLFSAGLCAAQAATGERNNLPIQIKSTELLTDNAARTATFTGKVSARQGDITIYSDKLVIHYSAGDKDVDKVEAFGNVRIIQENRRGEAEHAVYENKAGKIILDGNPKVVQGEDTITGKVITYFVDEQKSVVTSGPGEPVKAVIHPKDKGKNGGAKQ